MDKELTPRDRLLRLGPNSLSDTELLSILVRSGNPGTTALRQAETLLSDTRGLNGLLALDTTAMQKHGFGRVKVATLLSAIELGRRIARRQVTRRRLLNRPAAVAGYVTLRYTCPDQEILGALYLDVRNRLITDTELYRGTLSRAAVEPRAILKQALKVSASGFILFHTHPSGDPSPSREDIAFTKRMVLAADLIGVRLIDHLILGDANRWVSLQRRGLC